jgi:hypothetical protein
MPESPHVEFARRLVETHALTPDDLVIEVGSGKGRRLRAIRDRGPRVVGVEPELVTMVTAWNAGIDTVCAPFDESLARYLVGRYGGAAVVIVPTDEMRAVATRCLAPGGAVVIGDEFTAPVRRAA